MISGSPRLATTLTAMKVLVLLNALFSLAMKTSANIGPDGPSGADARRHAGKAFKLERENA